MEKNKPVHGFCTFKPVCSAEHRRQTCCHPAQLLPSGQQSSRGRTSCSMLPWLQRWRGWGCKLWEHTRCCSLVALTAIWRWRSSHIAPWISSADTMQHTVSIIITMMLIFLFVKKIWIPAQRIQASTLVSAPGRHWQTYSTSAFFLLLLLFAFLAPLFPEGISTGHPFLSPAPQRSVDTPSIIPSRPALPQHHLYRPVSGTSADCCLAVWLSLFLLMIYYIITKADSEY